MIGDIEFPSIEIIDTCKILKDFNLCVIYNLGGFFGGGTWIYHLIELKKIKCMHLI